MSIMYKPTEPLEVEIGESMPAEFVKEAERSRARTVSLTDEIKRLKAKNAKLRELIHDLLQPILADGFDCYGCEEDCKGRLYTFSCKLLDRARELGIEVER